MILHGNILCQIRFWVKGFYFHPKNKYVIIAKEDHERVVQELNERGYYLRYVGSYKLPFLFKMTEKERNEWKTKALLRKPC